MKNDIERVHKIDDVDVSSPIDAGTPEKAKGENKPISYYAVPRDSALETIFETVLDTIAGKNKAGKGLGQIKNIVTWIIPAAKPIDKLTDEIGNLLKQTDMENPTLKESKTPSQSKTLWINGIIGIVSLAMIVGFVDPQTVSLDPTAPWVTGIYAVVNIFLRFVTKKPVGADA